VLSIYSLLDFWTHVAVEVYFLGLFYIRLLLLVTVSAGPVEISLDAPCAFFHLGSKSDRFTPMSPHGGCFYRKRLSRTNCLSGLYYAFVRPPCLFRPLLSISPPPPKLYSPHNRVFVRGRFGVVRATRGMETFVLSRAGLRFIVLFPAFTPLTSFLDPPTR